MQRLLQEHRVVSSVDMLAELADVLTRDKFAEIKESQVNSFLTILARKCVLVGVKQGFKAVAEDHDDDTVLTTAHNGKARYIVSGDNHLLRMKEFKGIKIVTVKRMLDLVED